MQSMTLNDWATLVGILAGTIGLVLGVLNYLRDRAKVTITLQWDRVIAGEGPYDKEKTWGQVTVANCGRRTIYVSHVHFTTYPRWARP